MRRIAVTVPAHDLEDAFDVVLPAVPEGVFERHLADATVELSWSASGAGEREAAGAVRERLGHRALAWTDDEIDEAGWAARTTAAEEFGGRLVVRPSMAPPPPDGMVDVVLEPGAGGFGSGEHPTTRGCLELLLDIEPEGELADLGCGSGVVAIAAAKLGFAPVFAVDHEPASVRASAFNARANGVALHLAEADLLASRPPPAATIVANVPLSVHRHLAEHLDGVTRTVVASGLEPGEAPAARTAYAAAGLGLEREHPVREWTTLLLRRRP